MLFCSSLFGLFASVLAHSVLCDCCVRATSDALAMNQSFQSCATIDSNSVRSAKVLWPTKPAATKQPCTGLRSANCMKLELDSPRMQLLCTAPKLATQACSSSSNGSSTSARDRESGHGRRLLGFDMASQGPCPAPFAV